MSTPDSSVFSAGIFLCIYNQRGDHRAGISASMGWSFRQGHRARHPQHTQRRNQGQPGSPRQQAGRRAAPARWSIARPVSVYCYTDWMNFGTLHSAMPRASAIGRHRHLDGARSPNGAAPPLPRSRRRRRPFESCVSPATGRRHAGGRRSAWPSRRRVGRPLRAPLASFRDHVLHDQAADRLGSAGGPDPHTGPLARGRSAGPSRAVAAGDNRRHPRPLSVTPIATARSIASPAAAAGDAAASGGCAGRDAPERPAHRGQRRRRRAHGRRLDHTEAVALLVGGADAVVLMISRRRP